MVVVKVIGGLGNQIFQYAAGRALAKRAGVPLYLDLSSFLTYRTHGYALDHFKIRAKKASRALLYMVGNKRLADSYSRLRYGRSFFYFNEGEFRFNPEFQNLYAPVYLDGYWQCEKYFSAVKDELREELTPATPLNRGSELILGQISHSPSVSLHIRRGDYVTDKSANAVHGVLSLDYYKEAISRFSAFDGNVQFFIFSDDMQWVKDNLPLDVGHTFVDVNGPEDGWADLYLMSKCSHHIIANSTFSWWAAYLNRGPEKRVIGPQAWFRDPKMTASGLRVEGWDYV